PTGRIVYTQWLNDRGGIEADLTVTRLSETVFIIITAAANAVREMSWLQRHIPDDAHCIATDVTSGEAVLALMGPKARDVLQPITNADLSNEAFPFGTAQPVEIGMGLARAHRVTYVGELGWEIYTQADMASHVFETIMEAGSAHGLRLCGMHALDSCRIEKAFRHFGHDITDEDHVLEAGLGFAVKVDKPSSNFGGFIGREAVMRRKEEGLSRRLLQFKLNDADPMLYHNEPIWRDGSLAGYVSSGNYGHYLGASIGLGYVGCEPGEPIKDIVASSFEIEIAGERFPAQASSKPFYDPKSERVRA
ncbi:MAG: aminomethyltransferase family protein, partial [Pseudomonadota bacterium]